MDIKIEKGVDLPAKHQCGLTGAMRLMEIGDSFLVPKKSRAGLNALAERARIKITTRAEGEEQVRVWRTA